MRVIDIAVWLSGRTTSGAQGGFADVFENFRQRGNVTDMKLLNNGKAFPHCESRVAEQRNLVDRMLSGRADIHALRQSRVHDYPPSFIPALWCKWILLRGFTHSLRANQVFWSWQRESSLALRADGLLMPAEDWYVQNWRIGSWDSRRIVIMQWEWKFWPQIWLGGWRMWPKEDTSSRVLIFTPSPSNDENWGGWSTLEGQVVPWET